MPHHRTEKKVAVISGGTGAIGSSIAARLARDGFEVVSMARRPPLQSTSSPGVDYTPLFLQCDIARSDEVNRTFAHIRETHGRIDACVHCASSEIIRKKFFDMSIEEFRSQFNVGLFGGFCFLQAAAAQMKVHSYGRILAITSSGIEPGVSLGSMPGYISSKYALRGLLREMARELAQFNITVNTIAPGFIPEGIGKGVPPRMIEFLKERNLFHKTVEASDVAALAAFLCSEAGGMLTGLQIPLTYGETMTL